MDRSSPKDPYPYWGNGSGWVEFSEALQNNRESPGHSRFCPTPIFCVMHKRRAEDPKEARKRKKGTTYSIATLDPPNSSKRPVENIRVWDVSTSEQTGRVSATRRIVMHQHKGAPDQPEEQTTGKGDEGGGEAHVEEAGTLADSESSPEMEKPPQRRQRAKKASKSKGNDSGPNTQL
ncbi:hypothetical protein BJ322DRAFT_1109983 [Thelephora terrestris]|uniref:Uncharacterized protein n=1 Tax=Thelephora terrestris TaxID=56493 RepID=A0A9P6L6E0_9AGAM|nr:hypothetical protein BJ322DRAFT_1109983 [Thelephora terrestris]